MFEALKEVVGAVKDWCHSHEIWVAVILAAVFGLIFGIFEPRSTIGKVVNLLRNKLAERSVGKLNERIKKLSDEKGNLERFITSERALYLRVLRHLMASVLFGGIGIFVLIITVIMASDKGVPRLPIGILYVELTMFQLVIMAAWTALKISMLDSKEKLAKAVEKLDKQIGTLKLKLSEKTGEPKVKSVVAR